MPCQLRYQLIQAFILWECTLLHPVGLVGAGRHHDDKGRAAIQMGLDDLGPTRAVIDAFVDPGFDPAGFQAAGQPVGILAVFVAVADEDV